MNIVLSWLKEYVDVELPLDKLAHLLTMAGLEVEEVRVIGLPMPEQAQRDFKITGLSWDREKIVVAQIDEVLPHPNADRLVLCRLKDGQQDHVVLTGAPNLYPFKGQGPLAKPIKVAYAREGARIYDGHQPGQVLTTLKRAKIRGVESYSMVCSEKELGISDEHEGVIFLDDDAPTGAALADYIGDAVFEISILPNMIRNACVVGAAREVAALTGQPLRKPALKPAMTGAPITGQVSIQINEPELNPRFVVGLVRGAEPKPSPYRIQLRLRLAGMRPINSIVDATNYVMLELGEPLHAFDYDVLKARAGGQPPTIITRRAGPGETLTTLDGVERKLEPYTILVTDTAGPLSLAGVMGGMESEVTPETRNILLEGAAWNFINTRRTVTTQRLPSEAGYRFSRGVHPNLALEGVLLGLERLAAWSGGEIADGLVDEYPQPYEDPRLEVSTEDVRRLLGIELSAIEIARILSGLEFDCQVDGDVVKAQTPPHRTDIGRDVIGRADLMEEIARHYGYDRIPSTRLSDSLPPARSNPDLALEERVRDILAGLGLQEVVSYRLTSAEREARIFPPALAGSPAYVRLANPLAPERSVMRREICASVMELLEKNARLRERLGLFEIGPVFLPVEGQILPDEPVKLAVAMTGQRTPSAWDAPSGSAMDFYDLKGALEGLLEALNLNRVSWLAGEHPALHPGKTAVIKSGEITLGVMGELHPLVRDNYDLPAGAVLLAELDLAALLAALPARVESRPVPGFPPVLEDVAVVVDEAMPVEQVMEAIRQGGGALLSSLRLFDVFRGPQVGEGKKSLAFSMTYQALDRTLNDTEAGQLRGKIIRRLEQSVGGKVRSQ